MGVVSLQAFSPPGLGPLTARPRALPGDPGDSFSGNCSSLEVFGHQNLMAWVTGHPLRCHCASEQPVVRL